LAGDALRGAGDFTGTVMAKRTATWSASPQIYSTVNSTNIGCKIGCKIGCMTLNTAFSMKNKQPGAVDIANTGMWNGHGIGLIGGQNRAKIGVTTSGAKHYAIFGDLNQQGTIYPPHCERSQNGRGGMFFVVQNEDLFSTLSKLVEGDSEPAKAK
jgi:hypothetical protein